MLKQIKIVFKKFLLLINEKEDNSVVFYIGNNAVLPEPLTIDEEKRLVILIEQQNDSLAREKLIEHNLRLVVYIAKKFENTGINMEDLVSIGTIGLVKSINTFRSDKNIKLATYASRCIENEILMYLRRTSRIKTEVSIDEPLNVDWEGNELLLSDVLGTDNDSVYRNLEEETDRMILKNVIDKLNKREKQIVMLRYGIFPYTEEKTQKEVADMLGISQSYISRLEKKIISRLKKEFMKMI